MPPLSWMSFLAVFSSWKVSLTLQMADPQIFIKLYADAHATFWKLVARAYHSNFKMSFGGLRIHTSRRVAGSVYIHSCWRHIQAKSSVKSTRELQPGFQIGLAGRSSGMSSGAVSTAGPSPRFCSHCVALDCLFKLDRARNSARLGVTISYCDLSYGRICCHIA